MKKIGDGQENEYRKEDLYCVATNSGGYSCGGLYWVKKSAKKSKTLLIKKKKEEIKELERSLEWAKNDLIKLTTPNKPLTN